MLKSLDAIAEVNTEVKPVGDATGTGQPGSPAPPAQKPRTAGFVPDIVVLLTDGANTRGITPVDAIPYAVDRRVRVYTIGFGTPRPTTLSCSVQQLNGDTQRFGGVGFGGGGFGGAAGGRSPLLADDDTLRRIAEETGGTAYKAEDAAQLRKGVRRAAQGRHQPEAPAGGHRPLRRPRRPARRGSLWALRSAGVPTCRASAGTAAAGAAKTGRQGKPACRQSTDRYAFFGAGSNRHNIVIDIAHPAHTGTPVPGRPA